MRYFFPIFFALFIFVTGRAECAAGDDEQSVQEIVHLLNFVANSDCTFVRNGEEFSGIRARQHIERKYHHFKEKIDSAADFIHYAARGSSMTGINYQVRCGDALMTSENWLAKELARRRSITKKRLE